MNALVVLAVIISIIIIIKIIVIIIIIIIMSFIWAGTVQHKKGEMHCTGF